MSGIHQRHTDSNDLSPPEIVAKLGRFRNILTSHLQLEDTLFYPSYFSDHLSSSSNSDYGKKLLADMDPIKTSLFDFIDKYSTTEEVTSSPDQFHSDLTQALKTLSTRVATEEKGIFDVYSPASL